MRLTALLGLLLVGQAWATDHEGGRNFADGLSQIFRLEGPAAVFHYRGEPHLHALFNVGMNGEQPLSVGEVVAENPSALDRQFKAKAASLFRRPDISRLRKNCASSTMSC